MGACENRDEVEVRLTRRPWSDAAADDLTAIDLPSPIVSLGWFRRQVETGELILTAVEIAGERVGHFLWRVERGDLGGELVVVMAAGRHPTVDLTLTVLPVLESLAAGDGLHAVRFHTNRAGLARKARDIGYGIAEIVLRKRV